MRIKRIGWVVVILGVWQSSVPRSYRCAVQALGMDGRTQANESINVHTLEE
ncbi:hypothetical protein H0178_43775 [Cytobacillus firmus]|nr:hypothetical protein [Cytobacillus firmus]